MRPLMLFTAAALAVALPAAPAGGIEPAGSEFLVNEPTPFRERHPVAAVAPDGSALVVWENMRLGLLGRRLGTDGEPRGEELTLVANGELPPNPGEGEFVSRQDPALLGLPGGGFFLFWTEEDSYVRLGIFRMATEVRDRDVYGQRFDPSGRPVGDPRRLSSSAAGFQSRPRAVLLADGRILVVWESAPAEDPEAGAVVGRLLEGSGEAAGEEFPVSPPGEPAAGPAPAAGADGGFLVAWVAEDPEAFGIFARLFDPSGVPRGGAFRVNTTYEHHQLAPAAAADAGGGYLVAWQNELVPFERYRIFGQRLSAAGEALGPEFQVIPEGELRPELSKGDGAHALVPTPEGGFATFWVVWGSVFPWAVHGAELGGEGEVAGEPLRVSEGRVQAVRHLGLGSGPGGDLLAVWEGVSGRTRGILARRLRRSGSGAEFESIFLPARPGRAQGPPLRPPPASQAMP